MGGKSEVYSWRVSPALKASLEEAARREGRTLARLLDQIAGSYLNSGAGAGLGEEQKRLHAKAERFAGRIAGKDPDRAARARLLVRDRLQRPRRAR